jgi:hypothetical protein
MKKLISALMVLTLVASCSSSTKKSIEADKKAIGTVQTEEQLVAKAKEILKDSPLSQDKKDKFIAISKKYRNQLEAITLEIKQHRLVLFKTISSKKYSETKFNKVQKKLKKLVNKRFDVYIQQYMDAKEVLGVELQNVYDDPWFEMHHRF